jgi:hypothetical protein
MGSILKEKGGVRGGLSPGHFNIVRKFLGYNSQKD